MASPHTVKVLGTTRVTPASDSPISATEFSHPLTFFDTLWFKFHPVERIFFYQLNVSNPEYFHSVILPKLKRSLSLTLLHYLPLAAFSQGFCVGITAHHAILDGRSTTMFVKSWAYLCKQGNTENSSLPPELTPFYDRSVIKDPSGLDLLYLKQWLAFTSSDSDPNRRSLIIEQNIRDVPDDLVRATFDLSREHIKSLREKVLSKLDKAKPLHLSSFVLTFAYVSTCLIKARGGESDRTVNFGFAADARSRLNPPIPENYFGNCVLGPLASAKAGNFMDENGFATAAELASDMVKELEMNGILEQAEKKLTQFFDVIMETGKQVISVSGSPRFGVYGADFGWGKPRKVVIVSIDRGGAISLAESRDGSALIEIGLALNKHEMKTFASLFLDGLRDL
ncbi:HXXXD-type acyl-transferase family protein, putative [Theobroma cacao]|uniref:HXXXD-type acyl-transferase family protein, putative n=1 Tax=Theobroma cacao TaxID=3641 RepID=A0A061EFE9_THECC|nr:HXXXD-type acyl-transferase family protein, putative [Theobroma cacao]